LRETDRQGERPCKSYSFVAGLVAQLLLISLVVVTPWLFGGVGASVQVWLLVVLLGALGCWLIKQTGDRSAGTVLPVVVVVLICAIGLGVFQLVPLEGKTHAFLSPKAAELRSALLAGEPSADASVAKSLGVAAAHQRQPLSLYPASTRHDLALLVLGVAVFVAGAVLFRTSRARTWLCCLIALNGAAMACFGIIQKLTWNGFLYWSVARPGGGIPFGSFVNRNNAAGFLNLCLAGAVGMMVWAVGRSESNGFFTGSAGLPEKGRLPAPLRQRLPAFLFHPRGLTIATVGLAGLIAAGVLSSLSRGGVLAMIGATMLTTLIVFCAGWRAVRLWWIAAAAAVGLALTSWAGMGSSLQTRLATLLDQRIISEGRIPHWRDAVGAVPDFWRLGSGLGTYRYIYGQYQQRPDIRQFYHAENQPLESLVDGGIPALGLMLIAFGLVGMANWRLLRDNADAKTFAFGVAGVFALTTQAIHACFDFGLYLPANMILFALLCGSVSARAARHPRRESPATGFALGRVRFLSAAVVVLLLAAGVWGCLEIRRLAAVDAAVKKARFAPTPTAASPADLQRAMGRLTAALRQREDDPQAHLQMAKLWIHLYRVRTFEQLCDEAASGTDKAASETDEARLWQITSPVALHARAHYFARNGRTGELERLRNEPVIRDHLRPALKHLVLARRSCPLLPRVHLMMAQLCGLAVEPAKDQIHIARSLQLAPTDPDVLFQCGLLEFQAGRIEAAYACWRKSLGLSPRRLGDVWRVAGGELSTPGVIEKLLPDSPALLVRLAREKCRAEEDADVRCLLLRRVESLIEQGDLPQDERYYLQGAVLALKEQYPQAIAYYSLAVELRAQEVRWRYELALLLRQEGMIDQAHEQARLCVRMKPNKTAYRKLLQETNHTRLTASTALE